MKINKYNKYIIINVLKYVKEIYKLCKGVVNINSFNRMQ